MIFCRIFPALCCMAGLKGAEKDAIMSSFAAGELKVLVSTTVIEVGVNVPNATLMVIEMRSASAWRSCTSCADV